MTSSPVWVEPDGSVSSLAEMILDLFSPTSISAMRMLLVTGLVALGIAGFLT
jgi:hypothetical protein